MIIVERDTGGGTCVNTGCIPSKALLAAAEARHVALGARLPGVPTHAAPVDWPALVGANRDLVENMRADKYADLAAEYGWQIMAGVGCFAGDPQNPLLQTDLAPGGVTPVRAAHHVVATGSASWVPRIDRLAESGYLTSTTAMDLGALPASMIVVGARRDQPGTKPALRAPRRAGDRRGGRGQAGPVRGTRD